MSNLKPVAFTIASVREEPARIQPRGSNIAARRGLAYEKKVWRELERLALRAGFQPQRHPLYRVVLADKTRLGAEPDMLIHLEFGIIVVEVKLTWVPEAHVKLEQLYVPAVEKLYDVPAKGLVVCKNLTPESPPCAATVSRAFQLALPLLHWPAFRPLEW